MEQRTRITNAFQFGLVGTLGVLSALLLGAAISQTATILTYVAIAIFVALGLDPVVRMLTNRRLPRPAAIAIVVAAFLAVVSLLVWAVVPAVVTEGMKLIGRIPGFIDQLVTAEWVAYWDDQLNGSISNATENLLGYISDSSNWPSLLGGVLQVGIGAATGAVGFLVVVILSIYFMASLESMKSYVAKLVSASKRERFTALTDQVTYSVGRWVMGQVTVAAIHSAVLFVFLSIVEAPYAPLLAVVAFVFAIVPLIGSVSAAVLATLISLVTSPTLAITVGIFYLIYLQVEAYLVSPRVMKRAVQVPAALVVVAALMGGTLLGILGAVIAIPMAASVLLIVREVWMPRQQLR
ncbi:MAG: AI-2E family transporter [Actinobacteria bacterium]|nr:AI-2E family transporter [Actinomycetota bacterium]